METKVTKLIKVLEQIIELLEWDGENHWHNIMVESKGELLNSDLSGVDTLLETYGGMGSFNDFVIGQVYKDHKFIGWKDGQQEKDEKLRSLQSLAYGLAVDIKRTMKTGK